MRPTPRAKWPAPLRPKPEERWPRCLPGWSELWKYPGSPESTTSDPWAGSPHSCRNPLRARGPWTPRGSGPRFSVSVQPVFQGFFCYLVQTLPLDVDLFSHGLYSFLCSVVSGWSPRSRRQKGIALATAKSRCAYVPKGWTGPIFGGYELPPSVAGRRYGLGRKDRHLLLQAGTGLGAAILVGDREALAGGQILSAASKGLSSIPRPFRSCGRGCHLS